jgi:threonine dehydrogenase-like Zn-dependent dehydrogenase
VGGGADTLRAAGAAVRPGGVVSVVGVFLAAPPLDPMTLMFKEATLAWSYCYGRATGRADFAEAVALLDAERDVVAPLVTHRLPLDRVAEAYATAGDRRAGAIKVSLAP